jgi:SAM-dependent methyltransferase
MPSIVKSFRVLADPTRLRLLLLLQQEELSVVELQEILCMGQSRISSHLAQLKQAGLLQGRRAGKNIYYVAAPFSSQIHELVQASAKEIPETAADKSALNLVCKKRQDKTREYFNQLAGRLGRSYCPGRTWEGLAHLLLPWIGQIVIADLGAGEGALSQLLAKYARKVIAVDNSEKMVEFGAETARRLGFRNLEYRLGDIEDPPIDPESVDLVIFSQALHHASNPTRAINAAFNILKSGGRIAVLDLLSHNFEQARELYADLWLGFSETELHRMFKAAGFRNIEAAVVAREKKNPYFRTVLATGVK